MTREVTNEEKKGLILYIIGFYVIWSSYVVFLYPHVLDLNPFIGVIIKLLVWTLPVCIIIKVRFKSITEYLHIRDNNWGQVAVFSLLLGCIIVVWNVIGNTLLFHNEFNLNRGVATWLNGVVLIGFTEEVVFRGYILQSFAKIISFGKANVISSILFVVIHLPGWYQKGFMNITFTFISSILYVFIFAIIQGYVFKKTNSLWTCIFIHTINNFITIGFGL